MQNTDRLKIRQLLLSQNFDFDELAMLLFKYQYSYNDLFARFVSSIRDFSTIHSPKDIPFLPIESFKRHQVNCKNVLPTDWFESSGTTGMVPSRHYYEDLLWYDQITDLGWKQHYGDISGVKFLALLPSYLERKKSSLLRMTDQFILRSQTPSLIQKKSQYEKGYYLYDHENLYDELLASIERNTPTVLMGVSFALLDFVEHYSLPTNTIIFMETGGMKGRRKEVTREMLHQQLMTGLGVTTIHSEYGMTELFSQGYSQGGGIFQPTFSMKVGVKEINDPLGDFLTNKTGIVHVIDLANIDSCAFIRTEDLGSSFENGHFTILGRVDYSDMRGCNLMIE